MTATPEDFSFVPTLGTAWETLPHPDMVEPGTHTSCILRESMRPLDASAQLSPDAPDIIPVLVTSFPDLLPEGAGQEMLGRSQAIFTRGEFLLLRAVGGKITRLPLGGEPKEDFDSTLHAVAAAAPPVILHRMTDYNSDEFTFRANDHDPKYAGLRGSRLLLADEKLLEHELGVVRRLQTAGKDVAVVLPFVTSPAEQDEIQHIVAQEVNPFRIGSMVERADHARDILDYPAVDFLLPGPSDLTTDVSRSHRGDYREGQETEREVAKLVQTMVDTVGDQVSPPEVLVVKILLDRIRSRRSELLKKAYMPHQLTATP